MISSSRMRVQARIACIRKMQSKTFFAPNGNCFGYVANEWMTFQVKIKTGTARQR